MIINKTITSVFMVPTLKIPKNELLNNNFINAYVKDKNQESNYDNCIYLLFNPLDVDKFREFLDEEYLRTKNVIDDYDYKDGYVVVVYELNKIFKEDFNLIKEGKYSKTSKEFQELFPKSIKIDKNGLFKEELTLQYRIFNKTEDLIDFWDNKLNINLKNLTKNNFEVWETWSEEKEILNINTIYKNEKINKIF